jgi:hypothetical protein
MKIINCFRKITWLIGDIIKPKVLSVQLSNAIHYMSFQQVKGDDTPLPPSSGAGKASSLLSPCDG